MGASLDWEINFPTGRLRIGRPELFDEEAGVSIAEVCSFIMMPTIYSLCPAIATLVRGEMGCFWSLAVVYITLAFGWAFHLCERWALDMFCMPDSFYLQPTAAFHVLTGLTLMFMGIHIRSFEFKTSKLKNK